MPQDRRKGSVPSEAERYLFRSCMSGIMPLRGTRPPTSPRVKGASRPSLPAHACEEASPLCESGRDRGNQGRDSLDALRHLLSADWRDYMRQPVAAQDRLLYRTSGVRNRQWERLRRGRLPCKESLDLHGERERSAQALLCRFLSDCRCRGLYCVRVVHGKGHHVDRSCPALKNMVNVLLRHHPEVLAFCSAQNHHGGTGAMYVLLRGDGAE